MMEGSSFLMWVKVIFDEYVNALEKFGKGDNISYTYTIP